MHRMTWYTDTCEIMVIGLLYRLHFMVNVCVGGLGSSGFCDQCSHCQMIGHYRTYITISVGHPRLESVKLLVVDGSIQWLGHQYCIIGLLGQRQPC